MGKCSFRLGYVANALGVKKCTPSSTVTYKNLCKLNSEEIQLRKLKAVAKSNLEDTLRILRYNKYENIQVYRLTSKLIPLATHEEVLTWDYVSELEDEFKKIGSYIKENEFRVSLHPDHFVVLNTPDDKVYQKSINDLIYHQNIYRALGLNDNYKLVVHVGGEYGNKEESKKRFIKRYSSLPSEIKKRIIIENDDKIYNLRDVLDICLNLNIPMVLDVHHHICNNNGENLSEYLPSVFSTWKNCIFPPKIHFSSPKSEREKRSHADYIDSEAFIEFLRIAKSLHISFDVMLEAKSKDFALIKLSEELNKVRWIRRINTGEFEII